MQPAVKINRVNDLIVYVQTVGGSILDPVRSSIEVLLVTRNQAYVIHHCL